MQKYRNFKKYPANHFPTPVSLSFVNNMFSICMFWSHKQLFHGIELSFLLEDFIIFIPTRVKTQLVYFGTWYISVSVGIFAAVTQIYQLRPKAFGEGGWGSGVTHPHPLGTLLCVRCLTFYSASAL